MYIARDLEYLDEKTFGRLQRQARRTGEIISGLIRYLKTRGTQDKRLKQEPCEVPGDA